MKIGDWVRRENARPEGKWHLVESIIATRVVLRCGKEMESRTAHGGLEISEVEPLTRLMSQPQLCHGGCS